MANIGGMATFKDRIGIVNDAIRTIATQIDLLMIYCNDTESYDALTQLPSNVKKYFGENITDRGKFHFCYPLFGEDHTYFTFDDDLLYPKNYVKRTLIGLSLYGAIVGYHGQVFVGDFNRGYYADQTPLQKRFSFNFFRKVDNDYSVDVLGTGCMAFNLKYFYPMELTEDRMADVEICCQARTEGKQMVVLSHPHQWIRENDKNKGKWTVYEHFRKVGDTRQTEMIKKYFYHEHKSLAT